MKYKVLVSAPYLQLVIEEYRKILEDHEIEIVVPKVSERLSEDELLSLIPDIDGIICGDDRITEKVLANSPKLKVISKWGTGIDSIDQEAAVKRGIPVKNTVNAFTDPVADTVMGLILCFSRGIVDLNNEMKQGIWSKKLKFALHEKTLGIIGMGNVGKAVAKRAKAFGMEFLGNDIKEISGYELVSLEELLKNSDFISINCDLNSTSRHLINKQTLSLIKTTACLINTARGPIVDESALIEALEQKRIAGAALDVFEDEPLKKDHPFFKMPNVILSPHNANAGEAAWKRVHENTIKNLVEELIK